MAMMLVNAVHVVCLGGPLTLRYLTVACSIRKFFYNLLKDCSFGMHFGLCTQTVF